MQATALLQPKRQREGSDASRSALTKKLVKVPEITAIFWAIKILTTGMGESASDFLAQKTLVVPGVIGGVGLVAALVRQFRAKGYHAPTYWFTVAMVAVFGTVVADIFNPQAGGPLSVSLPVTTAAYGAALLACFAAWYASERTLSIHEIKTPRREAFYWLTVLLTFALGTAAGDWTAFYLNLGFGTSVLVFGAAILVPALLYRARVLNGVAAFWIAYVLTRPLGASLTDWLGKDKPLGLGVGDGKVALIAIALIVGLVTYLWRSGADTPRANRAAEPLVVA